MRRKQAGQRVARFVSMTALAAVSLLGCHEDPMNQQGRIKPLEPTPFFADGRSARPIPASTIARGHLQQDDAYQTGRDAQGQLVAQMPAVVTLELLRRGQQRFGVFCAPCHGQLGDGQGMISLRGFPMPPTFHDQRMRQAPDGHMFDVISRGFGTMPAYAQQIPVPDRWAIVSYLRALQRSQHASLDDLPALQREQLERER